MPEHTPACSPLALDGLLYGLTEEGVLLALDAETGASCYAQRLRGAAAGSDPCPPSLLAAAGRLYAVNADGAGSTCVVESGRRFRDLWSYDVEQGVGEPAFAADRQFVVAGRRILCAGGVTPSEPRAPNVAFDNPRTAADGLATSDQLDMYNGSPERYNWTLIGRKEILVPYNSYKLHSNELTYSDILTPLHTNQQHARYELHRVWVLDSVLKEGTRHVYKRRTLYIDEDSWQAMVVDCYDNRDQIWRVQEGHSINYYDVPTFWTTLETTIDLQSGRYLAIALNNEERTTYDFNVQYTPNDFSPASLRRTGVR
jgi:hypothetical protein